MIPGVDAGPIPGTLLTEPGTGRELAAPVLLRGYCVVLPVVSRTTGKVTALRVRVETPQGLEIENLRAVEVECEVVRVPDRDACRSYVGSLWFYDKAGRAVGFMPDASLHYYAQPGAKVTPRRGPKKKES